MIYRHENGIYYTKEAKDLFLLTGGRGDFKAVSVETAVHVVRSVFHIRTVEDIVENNRLRVKVFN